MLQVSNLQLAPQRGIQAQRLTFALSAGQLLWVKGDNGAGKTTLLQTLLGLMKRGSGDITWANPKPRIFYLAHDLALKPFLTVKEYCAWHPCVENAADAELIQALQSVNLLKHAHKWVGELSRGQQQRLLLACAILSKRPVWLLDEPLTALDVESVDIIQQKMCEHKHNQGALLVVSHRDITSIADGVVHVA